MVRNAIEWQNHLMNKAHLERADALALRTYYETVANNLRNARINEEKNQIQALANEQLNTREMANLAETIRNNSLILLEKEKQRLSTEQIEAAKRLIEQEANNIAKLKAEAEANNLKNQPTYEKDRNDATIKSGMYRGLGGLGAVFSAIIGTAAKSKVAKDTSKTALEKLARQIKPTSSAGVSKLFSTFVSGNAAQLASLLGVGTGVVGAAKAVHDTNKFLESDQGKLWLAEYDIYHDNTAAPSNAKRESRRKDEEDEIPEDESGLPENDSKRNIFKGDKLNETISKQTPQHEVSGNRTPNPEVGSYESSENNYQQQSSSGSNIIYSPGAKRNSEYGPGIS